MIKFFRKIRYDLMEQNKTGKYFKYAIGEIILVMIGILLALQVNNWNEDRKERTSEQKILNEILIDLEFAQKDLIRDIDINKRNLQASKNLIQLILNRKNKGDSIIKYMNNAFYATQFYPRTAGYQSLESKGLDLIRNDSLRKTIINLFDLTFQLTIREGREYDKMDNSEFDLDNYLRHHLIIDPNQSLVLSNNVGNYQFTTHAVKVRDFDALFNDDRFLTMLNKSIIGRFNKIGKYMNTMEESEIVSKAISKELKQF